MVTRVLIDQKNDKLEFRDENGNITFDKDSFYLRYDYEKLLNSRLIYNELLPIPVPCDNTYTALDGGASSVVAMANQGGHPVASLLTSNLNQIPYWDSSQAVLDSPNSVFVITPSIFGGGYETPFQFSGPVLIATAVGKITHKSYSIFMRSRISKILLDNGAYSVHQNSAGQREYYQRTLYTHTWYGPTDVNMLNLPPYAFGHVAIPEPFLLYLNKSPVAGTYWDDFVRPTPLNKLPTNGSINISWYSQPTYFNTVMSL